MRVGDVFCFSPSPFLGEPLGGQCILPCILWDDVLVPLFLYIYIY